MAALDENMGISLDTDMMDEDEVAAIGGPTITEQVQQSVPGEQPPLQLATASAEAPQGLAPTKVHLRGLDNMSTDHIKGFLTEHGVPEPGKFEWIDDTSLNLVYADENACAAALELMSLPTELHIAPWDIREAKRATSHPLARLEVRIAREMDKKERGARERSRYYLFHPEDDHVEQREQQRREREERRRQERRENRSHYRERDYPDRRSRSGSREYNRRYYDDAENARRNGGNQYEDMYDDEASGSGTDRRRGRNDGVELFADRPPPRTERNQGVELFGDRPRRANDGVELFPSKSSSSKNEGVELFGDSRSGSGSRSRRQRSRSPVELFPDRTAQRNSAVELFPENPSSAGRRRRSASPSSYRLPTPPRATQPMETIEPPRRGQTPPRANQKKTRSSDSRIELFPDRMQSSSGNGRSLEDRIGGGMGESRRAAEPASGFSIRGAAAAGRDEGFSIRGAAGGDSQSSGFSIRGAAGGQGSSSNPNAGVELLPNKGSLFSRVEEPNKGSKRTGRSRAQDLFG